MSSLFLGAIISIASTSVIVKVLREMKRDREPFAGLIYGILIVEDLLGVVMIVLLTGIASTGDLGLQSMAASTGKLLVFLVTVLVVGLLVVPRLLNFVARFESNERLLVAVLGLCFGTSLVAAKLGFSVALGAFLVGAVIAESAQSRRIEALVEPVRDLFTAVFFVAIGLLVDPALLWQHIVPIAGISLVVMIGQIAGNTFGTMVAGHDVRTAVRVGTGLSQIGEFSFVIATLGLTLKRDRREPVPDRRRRGVGHDAVHAALDSQRRPPHRRAAACRAEAVGRLPHAVQGLGRAIQGRPVEQSRVEALPQVATANGDQHGAGRRAADPRCRVLLRGLEPAWLAKVETKSRTHSARCCGWLRWCSRCRCSSPTSANCRRSAC